MGQNFGSNLKSVFQPASDDDPTTGVKVGRGLVAGGMGAASKLGQQQQPQGMPSPIQVAPQPQVNPDYFNPQNFDPQNFAPQSLMARPNSYQDGGTVQKTGMALVHKGETVIPTSKPPGIGYANDYMQSTGDRYSPSKLSAVASEFADIPGGDQDARAIVNKMYDPQTKRAEEYDFARRRAKQGDNKSPAQRFFGGGY